MNKMRVILRGIQKNDYEFHYINLLQKKIFGMWFTIDYEYIPYAVLRDWREIGYSQQNWNSKFIVN